VLRLSRDGYASLPSPAPGARQSQQINCFQLEAWQGAGWGRRAVGASPCWGAASRSPSGTRGDDSQAPGSLLNAKKV